MRCAVIVGLLSFYLTIGTVAPAAAEAIIVNSGDFANTGSFPGTGRGQGFQALSDFKIDFLAIFGDLKFQLFTVIVYESPDGSTVAPGVTVANGYVGGIGNNWNAIAIDKKFYAGNFYIVNWRPADGNDQWVNSLDYYWDFALPVTVGPIKLVDGIEGFNAEHSANASHPSFMYGIKTQVPEPAMLILLGSAISITMMCRRLH
jgi:hypothetical protein